MDIDKIIRDITYVIAHDDKLNSIYKNTWTLFRNDYRRYDILLNDVKSYNNVMLIIDFYKKSFDMCKNMRHIINKFKLTNDNENDFVHKKINNIIDHYTELIYCGVKNL